LKATVNSLDDEEDIAVDADAAVVTDDDDDDKGIVSGFTVVGGAVELTFGVREIGEFEVCLI